MEAEHDHVQKVLYEFRTGKWNSHTQSASKLVMLCHHNKKHLYITHV